VTVKNSVDAYVSLSPQHSTSSGCEWKRQPPYMEDNRAYSEQAVVNS